MRTLVTGGAGYIGAHVVRALRRDGSDVIVLDDFSSGLSSRVTDGVETVSGTVGDPATWERALARGPVDAVVHLAARKSVKDSVARPLEYYEQNVVAWHRALQVIVSRGVSRVLFSSSAAVNGTAAAAAPEGVVDESAVPQPESPYGRSKLVGEWLLADTAAASGLRWAALRYFNVVGAADPRLGDRSATNLMPRLLRAVTDGRPCEIFGHDYPTPDGTCVRDYVHVADVADAHAAALRAMADEPLDAVFNVGTGTGVSVLEIVEAVRRATGSPLPATMLDRRPGDPARVVADASRIAARLGWRARHGLDEIVESAWAAWQS
jgi:UDP-glucose 4-epimerase